MAEKDFYGALGVSKSASKDEIKSAYRKLAKKYHPDNKETGDEKKFKEIQEAYDVLYDDQKRSAYDRFGSAAFDQAGGNPGGNPFEGFSGFGDGQGVDLGDIFNSFFGGGMGGGRARQQAGPRRGDDVLISANVSFMDSINGVDITIPYTFDDVCPSCHGSGAKTANDVHTCRTCGGTGFVNSTRRSIFGTVQTQEVCPTCGGSGKTIDVKCPECGGKGYVRKKIDLKVHVPAGINSLQRIRVSGKGGRGTNGGGYGDLYVEIVVKPHEFFKRNGNDINVDIPLDFYDVALGTSITIPTVYGDKVLTIPSGTQPNTILKMKGFGVKDLRSGKPGDQYVKINVKVPEKLNKEQEKAINAFKDATHESDRSYDRFLKKIR